MSGAFLNGTAPGALRCDFNGTRVPASSAASAGGAASVRCHAPGSLAPGDVDLRLSLNAQDLTRDAVSYRFLAAATLSFATPALGPVAGNTTIFLSGAGLGGGTHYRCRIGRGHDVPASEDGGVVRCATPPGPSFSGLSLAEHLAPLRVSLNAQQWAPPMSERRVEPLSEAAAGAASLSGWLHFIYHHEPRVSAISPATAPAAGGLLVRVRGASLDGGARRSFETRGGHSEALWVSQLEAVRAHAEHRCRFRVGSGGAAEEHEVAGTLLVDVGEVLCAAPAVDGGSPALATVAISLNGGRDYGPAGGNLSYEAAPSLTELDPEQGVAVGGSVLTVRGTGLSPSLNLSCAFDGGSGATLTAASAAGGGAVRCAVPSLGEVSALSRAGDLVALGNFTLAGAAARLATSIRLTPPLNRDGTVATTAGRQWRGARPWGGSG